MVQPVGRRAAADYLCQLLLKPGDYRQSWEQHVVRARHDAINQLAVAEVLAQYQSTAVARRDGPIVPHQIKDTVSRALTGRLLSKPTLELFIRAFKFSDDEADRLRRLWSGSATVGVLSGTHAIPMHAEDVVRRALTPRRYVIRALHDHVYVGADRRIARQKALQVIEAMVAGTDRMPLLSDTTALSLQLGHGCKGSTGDLREMAPDVFATEILLARTLGLGDTITVEYAVDYHRQGDINDPNERRFRRPVIWRLENFDLRVQFHPEQRPAGVWWGCWDGVDGPLLSRQEAELDSQQVVQRYVRSVERTVVGFFWTW
jgi:hypothetical protein